MSEIGELVIAQIWNGQRFRQPCSTTDGRSVRVVYPGVWTHGFGPDFRGAMLEIDGQLHTGDVEVELEVSGWYQHGHDTNLDFDKVILQVVSRDSNADLVRRSDGAKVPRIVLPKFTDTPLTAFSDDSASRPLGAIGFDTCAPVVSQRHPELVREIWQRAGDQRMQDRVATISGEMAVDTPAQVLYARFLDALGFSRNRAPMAEVAARMPIGQLLLSLDGATGADRFWRAAGLLLGVAGFLPLSPREAATARLDPGQIGRLEAAWNQSGTAWRGIEVSPGFWRLARLRPAAHPVRRLLAGAHIIATAGDGLVEHLTQCLASDEPRKAVMCWLADENRWLGKDHAHELIVNVVIPFGLAYGDQAQQDPVTDAAAELWQRLPAGRGNVVTRSTRTQICGDVAVPVRSARAEQGLIHINRNGCSQMRCYECPVAFLALTHDFPVGPGTERL